jgi:hypothetical protein
MESNDRGRVIFALVLCVSSLGLTPRAQRGVESDYRGRFKQYNDLGNIRDGDLST